MSKKQRVRLNKSDFDTPPRERLRDDDWRPMRGSERRAPSEDRTEDALRSDADGFGPGANLSDGTYDPRQTSLRNLSNRMGRPAGVGNKLPRSIKEAIAGALEAHGEDGQGLNGAQGYMLMLARDHKPLFVTLLRRILPVEVKGSLDPSSLISAVMATAQARARGGQLTLDVTARKLERNDDPLAELAAPERCTPR